MSESPEKPDVWDELIETCRKLLTLILVGIWAMSLGLLMFIVMVLFALS